MEVGRWQISEMGIWKNNKLLELEDGRTLAELSSIEKNQLSARRLAAVDLKQKLRVLDAEF